MDDQGTVLETFDYYPFGLLMPKRNTTGAGTMEKFTGKERDEAIGLDYFGARYYDPALGRFLSVDPLADDPMQISLTPYNYTWNNPTNITDPDGQCPVCIGAAIGAVVDVGVQTLEISIDDSKSIKDFSLTSVAISAAAGATGVGLAPKLSKLGTVTKIAAESVFDATSSTTTQLAKEGEIDAGDVLFDVIGGQTVGKVAGDFVEGKFLNSSKGEYLKANINQQRNASLGKSNTIPKTKADIQGATDNLEKAKVARGGGASAAASTAASSTANQIGKEEDEKK